MAKLRMTYKNLKALRKTREYQALLVDLVAINIVPKSAAENLLGYNIPANLIGGESSSEEEPVVTPDNDEQGSGTEGSGTGTEGSGTEETGNTVTLLYFDATANEGAGDWLTATYTLTGEDSAADFIAVAQEAFNDETINDLSFVEENPEYVEGESVLIDKYMPLDPQPEAFAKDQLIKVFYESVDEGGSTSK